MFKECELFLEEFEFLDLKLVILQKISKFWIFKGSFRIVSYYFKFYIKGIIYFIRDPFLAFSKCIRSFFLQTMSKRPQTQFLSNEIVPQNELDKK